VKTNSAAPDRSFQRPLRAGKAARAGCANVEAGKLFADDLIHARSPISEIDASSF